MLRINDNRRMQAAFLPLALVLLCSVAVLAQERELMFEGRHRVTAHGSEFNGLVLSADGQRLFVASEKGQALVWDIAAGRIDRRLDQPAPIHLIAGLAGPQEFITAGSYHYQPRNAVIRRWDAKAGTHLDLEGIDKNSFPAALATEPNTGLIALTTLEGAVHVWAAASNKQIAKWEIKDIPLYAVLLGRDLYVATIDRKSFDDQKQPNETAIVKFNVDDPKSGPTDYLRIPERKWTSLEATPDYRMLVGAYDTPGERQTVLIDPASKTEIAELPQGNFAWINPSRFVTFGFIYPNGIAQVQANGTVTTEKFEPKKQESGNMLGVSGQVANADGSKVWASYSKAGGLVEIDLVTKKVTKLFEERSGAYAMSVDSEDGEAGHLLTGGADGYVRLWNLSDISLIKEYALLGPNYAVTHTILLPSARDAVVGLVRIRLDHDAQQQEPVNILLLDLETGQHKKIVEAHLWRTQVAVVNNELLLPQGDRIEFLSLETGQVTREVRLRSLILGAAVSANRKWLAIVDDAQKTTVFDLTTLKKRSIASQSKDAGPMAVTNDGRYVHRVAHGGRWLSWDMKTAKFQEAVLTQVREMHSNVDFVTLANDDKWVVVAGNHGDVGIFDRVTARLVSYTRVSAAAFYVEKVWVRGDRLIFTTDTGTLFDGRLR